MEQQQYTRKFSENAISDRPGVSNRRLRTAWKKTDANLAMKTEELFAANKRSPVAIRLEGLRCELRLIHQHGMPLRVEALMNIISGFRAFDVPLRQPSPAPVEVDTI